MKKAETLGFRISAETKEALYQSAEFYKQPAGQLVLLLVESFIAAHKKHKGRMVWPPRFVYLPEKFEYADGEPIPENIDFVKKVFRDEMKDLLPMFKEVAKAMEGVSPEEFDKDYEIETKRLEKSIRQQSGNSRKKSQ